MWQQCWHGTPCQYRNGERRRGIEFHLGTSRASSEQRRKAIGSICTVASCMVCFRYRTSDVVPCCCILHSVQNWQGDEASLLYEVGAAIGRALPNKLKRKELFEAFEVACLVQRQARQESYAASTVVDLCAGCGLLGVFLALMWPRARVIAMDRKQSVISRMLSEGAMRQWPLLRDRFEWKVCDMRRRPVDNSAEPISLPSDCMVVACHACGLLTDEAIAAACARSLRPMVLVPCCYVTNPKIGHLNPGHPCHSWERLPWLREGAVNQKGRTAIDDARIDFLRTRGYHVSVDHIDPQITRYSKAISAFPSEKQMFAPELKAKMVSGTKPTHIPRRSLALSEAWYCAALPSCSTAQQRSSTRPPGPGSAAVSAKAQDQKDIGFSIAFRAAMGCGACLSSARCERLFKLNAHRRRVGTSGLVCPN